MSHISNTVVKASKLKSCGQYYSNIVIINISELIITGRTQELKILLSN